jgi:thiol-disulfide isomerase/thioredoxin
MTDPMTENKVPRNHKGVLFMIAIYTVIAVLFFSLGAMLNAMRMNNTQRLIVATDPSPAPAVAYVGVEGKAEPVSGGPAKLLLVHFWATWCAPCVEELPALDRFVATDIGRQTRVIALSEDSSEAKRVQTFYEKHHIQNLGVAMDTDGKALFRMQVKGLPTTVFIDPEGNIVARATGGVNWDDAKVQKAVAELIKKQ